MVEAEREDEGFTVELAVERPWIDAAVEVAMTMQSCFFDSCSWNGQDDCQ